MYLYVYSYNNIYYTCIYLYSFFPVTEIDNLNVIYGVPSSACDVVKCVNVTIYDDTTLDMAETVNVSLSSHSESVYALSPVPAEIVITDNESKYNTHV